jgi:thiamine-phosphate pyrophosphorylase
MLLYYITDRRQFTGTGAEQRRKLLDKISEAARAGVDYIQLRERDLPARELESLAKEAADVVAASGSATRLLINSRVDIALACGAAGVHLRSDDPHASDARSMASTRADFVVGVSCHTTQEVQSAWSHGADFTVFAPVFEKAGQPGAGVEELRKACAVAPRFVFALGGVNAGSALLCAEAGAVGVAGIRLFQDGNMVSVATSLKIVHFPK